MIHFFPLGVLVLLAKLYKCLNMNVCTHPLKYIKTVVNHIQNIHETNKG